MNYGDTSMRYTIWFGSKTCLTSFQVDHNAEIILLQFALYIVFASSSNSYPRHWLTHLLSTRWQRHLLRTWTQLIQLLHVAGLVPYSPLAPNRQVVPYSPVPGQSVMVHGSMVPMRVHRSVVQRRLVHRSGVRRRTTARSWER